MSSSNPHVHLTQRQLDTLYHQPYRKHTRRATLAGKGKPFCAICKKRIRTVPARKPDGNTIQPLIHKHCAKE
jgi:hypothetical protein